MQPCGWNLNPSHKLKETNLQRHLVDDPIIQVYGYNRKMNTCQGLKESNEWVEGAEGIFMTVDLLLRAPACYVHITHCTVVHIHKIFNIKREPDKTIVFGSWWCRVYQLEQIHKLVWMMAREATAKLLHCINISVNLNLFLNMVYSFR